ncbi:hypothetical protein P9139_02610 [Curtobacterium flaccumfaciens]|nr:hypothetical protein P9139_02610 [Curtobacterium flaccumfaciens]
MGRPAVWQGVVWIAIGAVWLALAAFEAGVWRWIVGGAWVVLGVLVLAVALFDRKHGLGRYGRS